MNDAFYEQIVARKPRITDMLIRILVIVAIVALFFFGMPLIGFLAVLLAVALGFVAFYLIFPRLNVEYEYSILNHDMDIAAIYSKQSRKKRISFDIQKAEIIAPKGSHRLDSYHPAKIQDYSSGEPDANTYAVMLPMEQQLTCILIDPDAKMLEHIRGWMGSKMFLD